MKQQNLLGSGIGIQRVNGSPVKPAIQPQIGTWFTARHIAFKPQTPGHGSTHFWFIHDLSNEHSALIVHSGRQPGGEPIYSGKQEQTGWFSTIRHSLNKPHGDGTHGFPFGIGKYAFEF